MGSRSALNALGCRKRGTTVDESLSSGQPDSDLAGACRPMLMLHLAPGSGATVPVVDSRMTVGEPDVPVRSSDSASSVGGARVGRI